MRKLIFLFLLTTSCNQLLHGKVERKEFRPAYTSIDMQTTFGPKGEVTGSIPIMGYHPEEFRIEVAGEMKDCTYGKQVFNISKDEYNSLKIGDTYIHIAGECIKEKVNGK